MRLVTVESLDLVEVYGDSIPPYAILSHTWETQEVTFQEIRSPTERTRRKDGWLKIKQACKIAKLHGLDFLWIDTCCIDKTNSVELNEAINSMFRWYKNSEMCIAYLADLQPVDRYSEDAMFASRWWQRGWTLQELIAPRSLRFYDSSWQDNDSKSDWAGLISERVGIPPRALHGDLSPNVASVAQKFSWAANRRTTRLEDEAYCLLGLFDVSMPLLYGEGSNAFRRLQDEIIKNGDDLTIFAHSPMERTGDLFAEHAFSFRGLGDVRPYSSNAMTEFALTNRGLHVKSGIEVFFATVLEKPEDELHDTYYALLGHRARSDVRVGICLVKVAPQVYCRDATRILVGFGSRITQLRSERWQLRDCYILPHSDHGIIDEYENAIYLSPSSIREDYKESFDTSTVPIENTHMVLHDVVPRGMYYHSQRLILKREASFHSADKNVIALRGSVTLAEHSDEGARVTVVILIDFINFEPKGYVFEAARHQRLENFLFAEENLESSITWPLLRMVYPSIEQFRDSICIDFDSGRKGVFSVWFAKIESSDSDLPCVGACTLEVNFTIS